MYLNISWLVVIFGIELPTVNNRCISEVSICAALLNADQEFCNPLIRLFG